jgi:hypothetical protein
MVMANIFKMDYTVFIGNYNLSKYLLEVDKAYHMNIYKICFVSLK